MVNDVLLRPGLDGPDREICIAEGERATGCKMVAKDAKRELERQCFARQSGGCQLAAPGWDGYGPEIKESAYIQGTMASGYLIQGGPRRIEGQRSPTAGLLGGMPSQSRRR